MKQNRVWLFAFVIWLGLSAIMFAGSVRAEAPRPEILSRYGGLDCVVYNKKLEPIAEFRVFWIQMRDLTDTSMTFQTDDGEIVLDVADLWRCKQFEDEKEPKWYEQDEQG